MDGGAPTTNTFEPRVEEKVMSGSVADVSTEAGRQLMQEIDFSMQSAATQGLMEEASDRLYLKEQANIEASKARALAESQEAALAEFRKSTTSKAATLDTALALPKKTTADSLIKSQGVINVRTKRKKKQVKAAVNKKPAVPTSSKTLVSLVQYDDSSSSDSSSSDDKSSA